MKATEPTLTHLTESLWAENAVCGLAIEHTENQGSIWTEDTTCQDCLSIAHAVRGALTADEAAEPRRILIRDDEVVTIPVSDEAQKIIEGFWRDGLIQLAELLEPVGLDPTSLMMPRYRQVLYTDAQL